MKTLKELKAIKARSIDRNLTAAKQKLESGNKHKFLSATIAIPTTIYAALTPWERFEAKVVAAGFSTRKAVLSGFAAAVALEIPFLAPNTKQQNQNIHPNTVELTLPGTTSPSAKHRWSPHFRYLYGNLPSEHITESNNLRTTTIERTYLDILRLYGVREALAFVEAAMERYHIGKNQMLQRVKNLHNVTATKWAIALLNRAHNNVQSVYETLGRYLLEEAHLKEITSITPQAELREGDQTYYPDLLINKFLIVEIDGNVKYQTNIIETLLQERRRERELQRRGYSIIRFSPMEVEKAIVPIVRTTLQRITQRVRQAA